MLDARTAFKVGFLRRCADAGMTLEETEGLVKQAFLSALLGLAGRGLSAAGTATKLIAIPAAAAAIGAPLVLGAGTGAGIAALENASDVSPEQLKATELLDAYRRETEAAKTKEQLRQERLTRQSRPGRPIL